MTNTKFTKHALISSVALMVICFAMLLGTTFAWFTDSVVSAGNVITAGNLDVGVEYTLDGEKWADLDGAQDLFKKGLWEPGHTEVVVLKVTNKGSLYAKYNANMNIINEDIGKNQDGENIVLSDILEVGVIIQQAIDADGTENMIGSISLDLAFSGENSLGYAADDIKPFAEANVIGNDVMLEPGAAHYVFIKVDMPEAVGNEANHNGVNIPSIEFGVNVVATQYTHENDSFGPDYDKDAEYPIVPDFIVKTQEELKNALTEGGNIQLSEDIEIENSDDGSSIFVVQAGVEVTLDLNGKTIETVDGFNGMALFENKYGASLTITGDGTIKMNSKPGTGSAMFAPRGSLVIENGTFIIPYVRGNDEKPEGNSAVPSIFAGINVKDPVNNSSTVVVYDGYFDSGYWRTDEYVPYSKYGCAGPNTLVNLSTNETFTIYGGTFVGYNPAWGDEATCAYYAPVTRACQGVFLVGQEVEDTELPEGYTITEGVTEDGTNRPIYIVTYSK